VLVRDGSRMASVPPNVGVFFGQVDKQSEGWHWTASKSDKSRAVVTGPFETTKQTIDDALRSLAGREAGAEVRYERKLDVQAERLKEF
jgi:hypothetical protein